MPSNKVDLEVYLVYENTLEVDRGRFTPVECWGRIACCRQYIVAMMHVEEKSTVACTRAMAFDNSVAVGRQA